MKSKSLSREPLSNPQHEAFAQEVASGRNATHSYLKVYGTENHRTAAANGSRLLRQKTVATRIRAIQKVGAADVALDLRAIHKFLARVISTPAGEVTPTSDLCSRVKHTRDGSTDVWMPDKLACLRFSARLQGFLDPKHLAALAVKAAELAVPPVTEVRVLTEERRAVLIKNKRDATLRRIERQEEERELREQVRAQRKKYAEDGRAIDETPRRENSSTPASPQPAPPEPKPEVWIGPSGRYPYFGMNFRKPPQPPPVVPIIPPPDAEPNPPATQSPASTAAAVLAPTPIPPVALAPAPAVQCSQPETRNPKPKTRSSAPPRVTGDDPPKNVSNYHHPAEAEPASPATRQEKPITPSQDAQSPNHTSPSVPTAEKPNQKTEPTPPVATAAEEPTRKPPPAINISKNQQPETPRAASQPDYRVRLSHEAAVRRRLTGDDSTTHNTLVII